MTVHAVFERYQVIAAAALVGAHANAGAGSFRQRDMKFLFELFLNWAEDGARVKSLIVRNTQIARWLDEVAREGYARRMERGPQPRYRLTRVGLIEMVGRIAREPYFESAGRFFFAHFFLSTYRERLTELVRAEGAQFPHPLQVELRELLDTTRLCERQIAALEREIERLDARIRDSLSGSALVVKMRREGREPEAIVRAIEDRYPYELNSQKPLSDIAREMTSERLCWELDVGAVRRAELLFMPERKGVMQFLAAVRELSRRGDSVGDGRAG